VPAPPPSLPPPPAANWEYKSEGDKMRNMSTDIAIATSKNSMELEMPYNGGSRLQIELLKGGKVGNAGAANLKITNGQISCSSDGCSVSAKFDDKPVEKLAAHQEIGDDSNQIAIRNPSALLQKLKSARHAILEVTV
jgi:hypothetical protein